MSQCEILVDYFNSGKSLTVAEALTNPDIGVYALSQRCGEINKHRDKYGIEIESETVESNGKRYKRYRMRVEEELFT